MARRTIRHRKNKIVYVQAIATTKQHIYYPQATLDDAFQLIIDSINGIDISNSDLFDGRFNFAFRICGDQWSGAIDYKIAELTLKIQNDIIKVVQCVYK